MPGRRRVLFVVLSLMLLGSVTLFAVLQLRRPDAAGQRDPALLVLDVPRSIEEGPVAHGAFSFEMFRARRPALFEYVLALQAAATDDAVRGILLRVPPLDWDWAQVSELREALAAFRASGKPVHAVIDGVGEREYLLASVADRVSMPGHAHLWFDGLAASATFFKGSYDKLDIRPNFAHIGRYKSAVESYTRETLSPEAREALEALLDDTFRCLVDSVAVARRLSPDSVRALVDAGPYLAPEAMARGLIDTLATRDEADSVAHAATGTESDLEFSRYLARRHGAAAGPRVALLAAEGTIVPGRSREDGWQGRSAGARSLIQALEELADDDDIDAVVLRVNSPGGSAEASEDIWRALETLRRAKPVVVSMSGVAASGGYYIACGSDGVVAHPMTLTGSIGVFGGKLNVLGLYRKLGANVETVTRGRHADMLSPYRDFTPEEAAIYEQQMRAFYDLFLTRVSARTRLSTAAADSLAQGRVWAGVRAHQAGLVDALGGLARALDLVRERLDMEPGAPLRLEAHPRSERPYLARFVEDLLPEEDPDSDVAQPLRALQPLLEAARFPTGAVLALMPIAIEIR